MARMMMDPMISLNSFFIAHQKVLVDNVVTSAFLFTPFGGNKTSFSLVKVPDFPGRLYLFTLNFSKQERTDPPLFF